MHSIRSAALEKLARLSASTPSDKVGRSDIFKLCRRCPLGERVVNGYGSGGQNGKIAISSIPMTIVELETLIALCKAASVISSSEIAEQLLHQLMRYLPESCVQLVVEPAGKASSVVDSPWETLSFQLTSAILTIAGKFPYLRDDAVKCTFDYVSRWMLLSRGIANRNVDNSSAGSGEASVDHIEETLPTVMMSSLSTIGFMEALARHAGVLSSEQRFRFVQKLRDGLDENFMVGFEAVLSATRNDHSSHSFTRPWRRYLKHYAAIGRPLGSILLRLGFIRFVVASISLHVTSASQFQGHYVLNTLLQRGVRGVSAAALPATDVPIDVFAEIALDEIELLDEGSDYLQIGSPWEQHLAFSVKANALVCFLCCTILDDDTADPDLLVGWLESTMASDTQISNETLASCVFRCMAVLARFYPARAATFGRTLPRVIVQGGLEPKFAAEAAEALATILKSLPQDTIITTLYSLGNVLSSRGSQRNVQSNTGVDSSGTTTNGGIDHQTTGSTLSLAPSDVEEPSSVYAIVIQAIVAIANVCEDEKINALALSMLIQKIGRVSLAVDATIIQQSAMLGSQIAGSELRGLLKLYTKLVHDALIQDNRIILDAVLMARIHLSENIKRGTDRYEPYLLSLLEDVVSKGDAHDTDSKVLADVELASLEIASLLRPLAILIASNVRNDSPEDDVDIEGLPALQRDAWFNMAVHGFTPTSHLGKTWRNEMQILAKFSLPLVTEDKVEQLESDIELNTVLRRGKTSDRASSQRTQLLSVLMGQNSVINSLNYPELVFLTAANTVETLRASAGDLSCVLTYFLDPKLRSGALGSCMQAVVHNTVSIYLAKTFSARQQAFSSPSVGHQLSRILAGCCHRIDQVQRVALQCADTIITQAPSALCQRKPLFTLLELLTIMWRSCLEWETDEYEWTSTYTSSVVQMSVELSDNFAFRRQTLLNLHKWAKVWVLKTLEISPLDVKGLLQTYLADHDDKGSHGHISLGRSFALEMGAAIPSTDQRLGAVGVLPGVNFNASSDFIAQYTTRQEYRHIRDAEDKDQQLMRFDKEAGSTIQAFPSRDRIPNEAAAMLAGLEMKALRYKNVSITEIREPLRQVGALLCQTGSDQCGLVQHLVGLPFAVFTKQSIKLGLSLWMGVIKENPRLESRILVELAENWCRTVRSKIGFFNRNIQHKDPFYIKEEFAPSDRNMIVRQQHRAYDVVAPHFWLVQFLSSHFNATRLVNRQVQSVYFRLLHVTLDAIIAGNVVNHPLARETHFHIVLLGLRILHLATDLDGGDQWKLKDRLLSASLQWFNKPPRWSFGGNRLQTKAETHLLSDVHEALKRTAGVGERQGGQFKTLQNKQDLLTMLIMDEQTRLMVWLFPLDYHNKHHFTSGRHHSVSDASLADACRTAWSESPALAIHLTQRFSSTRLKADVRWLILNFPQRSLDVSEGLELLLGSAMPADVSFQLKYLCFWAAVNPMAAVTYFLPSYHDHPLIIQYAMRALESHSIDVTFFYVPQIVQALRYDVLGYVERYIVETGTSSQLFAHQIIWNMKANSYKDDDLQVPDSVKPTLDKVMASMIANFLPVDKSFYEREFAFFNEVTDISGKLKPFIKRPKPEKKQKIEEELRKIKVEVGVYLPCNPDGQVIGIDRKSGKPLQSHAKAPYMATFRIRKEIADLDDVERPGIVQGSGGHHTYEVWQSAIFKVGDDCRQDILALQMIAAFRGIFNNVGLDVYVYPYRVTATAPGCGVIDALPNSISRDMLGREAVNGLYDYFVSKYGGEDSVRFQEARNNFVKSMAAYSVISYILQFKDRHNGNIMIDDQGHILHIDFGFCFDIAPGGVRFERAPFKLTSEMVAVMGGSTDSQSYKWFEELCVKAFLASRMHCEHLAQIVICMLDSGLPCFKPETIEHFRDRFVLGKSDREAADFMRELVRKSHNSYSTGVYDQFQLLTNGIPY